MMITEEKAKVISGAAKHDKDVGSAEVQIAVLTARIAELTEHLKTHKKDNHSRRGLLQMVGKRKKLLKYLRDNDFKAYEKTLKEHNLRG